MGNGSVESSLKKKIGEIYGKPKSDLWKIDQSDIRETINIKYPFE